MIFYMFFALNGVYVATRKKLDHSKILIKKFYLMENINIYIF